MKTCYHCRSVIPIEASVCAYCGRDVPTGEDNTVAFILVVTAIILALIFAGPITVITWFFAVIKWFIGAILYVVVGSIVFLGSIFK